MLLERWRRSGSFNVALRGTYGVTSGQFEEDWRRWIHERFGWVLVLSNSFVLWGLLGIMLALMVMVRRRWMAPGRRMMQWMTCWVLMVGEFMSCLPKQQGGVPGSGPEGGQFTQCRAC